MKKRLEVYLPLSVKRVRSCQVAYVNDTDFYANGSKCIEIMQEILEMHIRLYEATGAKIQDEKVRFYCWRYRIIEGERKCEEANVVLKVHGSEIEQIDVNKSTRTLGAHITPTLNWKK